MRRGSLVTLHDSLFELHFEAKTANKVGCLFLQSQSDTRSLPHLLRIALLR